ncbi:hypothetical protein TRFO_20022 [Tritrichomonas foetus]|uniref:Protein kinase domain-containing protein n=1 Tax=Tritrichomonas foetus TaxID=1144522 RepID=A0A1J4KLP6_9EUKA|nr:hypothetical protein TRFO_20022 [Tritrichomonas foetus]|eukprot:OHT10614.1 hypothetical protein TRFO_20022 [Tritrichomonas foetus]
MLHARSTEEKFNIFGEILLDHDYIIQEQIGFGGYSTCYICGSTRFANTQFVAKVIELESDVSSSSSDNKEDENPTSNFHISANHDSFSKANQILNINRKQNQTHRNQIHSHSPMNQNHNHDNEKFEDQNKNANVPGLSNRKAIDRYSESFNSELNALIKIIHPNIISVFDHFVDEKNRCLFLILEYCSNGTIEDMLKKSGVIRPPYLYSLCYQIVNALKFCEDLGLAHRDIKPSNVFIDKYGRVKLADFGLSFQMKSDDQKGDNAICNRFTGSLPYMPPEILNLQPFDPFKADIWSLGVTFYYMAIGNIPFLGKNILQLKELVQSADFSLQQDCHAINSFNIMNKNEEDIEFIKMIKNMLRVNPKERMSLDDILNTSVIQNACNSLRNVSRRRSVSKNCYHRGIRPNLSGTYIIGNNHEGNGLVLFTQNAIRPSGSSGGLVQLSKSLRKDNKLYGQDEKIDGSKIVPDGHSPILAMKFPSGRPKRKSNPSVEHRRISCLQTFM